MALDYWEIAVGPAQAIVATAQADVELLTAQENELINSFTDAAAACDHLDIGDALNGLLEGFAGPLLQAAHGAGLSVAGHTGQAIDAYVLADEDMASEAEQAIAAVPRPAPYEN